MTARRAPYLQGQCKASELCAHGSGSGRSVEEARVHSDDDSRLCPPSFLSGSGRLVKHRFTRVSGRAADGPSACMAYYIERRLTGADAASEIAGAMNSGSG
jgi:hypothetical protein